MELGKFKFNDLLPESVKNDPKFQAASEVLDEMYKDTEQRTKNLLIYSRIDELDERTIDDLAWQFNLNFFDGWALTADLEEKRSLIKFAFQQKMYKGTRWSIERTGELLNIPIKVIEWWQDDTDYLEPYEFMMEVDTTNKGLDENFYPVIIQLVENLKNVRSHLKRILTILNVRISVWTAVSLLVAEFGQVFPDLMMRIINNVKLYFRVGQYGYGSTEISSGGPMPIPTPVYKTIERVLNWATGGVYIPEFEIVDIEGNYATGVNFLPVKYPTVCSCSSYATGRLTMINKRMTRENLENYATGGVRFI